MATSVVNELVVWNDTTATQVASATGTGMAKLASGVVSVVPGYGVPMVSGTYYDQSCSYNMANWSAGAMTQLRLYASLIFIPTDVTITEVGTYVTTGVASALGRIGFYNVGSNGKPGTLFAQGSTTINMATSATAATLTGQSFAFKGGTWYYAAIVCDSAGVSTHNAVANQNLHGYNAYSSTTKISDYFVTIGSLSLPSPFGTPTGDSVGARRVSLLVP